MILGDDDYVPGNFEGQAQHAFLSLLMIASPFRNQGVGNAVIKRIEEEIRQDPRVTTILSGVQVNNPLALQFWQQNGYRIVSGPETLPDQTTVFRLRKDLPSKSVTSC